LYVLGKPEVSVVSFGSNDFNIYRLSDAMAKRGWNLNALQYPSSVHICVTGRHTAPGLVQKFLQDIRACTEDIMNNPGQLNSGTAAIYGMAQSVPDRSVVSEMAWAYLDTCAALPE
jgi:sphinganine-1-phosphate aldolase